MLIVSMTIEQTLLQEIEESKGWLNLEKTSKGYLAIPEEYDKLITSLRTAYAKELSLDKDQTSYDDLLDACRLSLKGYIIN
jgi:hypothetical protein